jgi:hypothetical protein
MKLLVAEGAYTADDSQFAFIQRAEQVRAMYGIARAGMIEPRLDMSVDYGNPEEGTIGVREMAWADVEYCYLILFRLHGGSPIAPVARSDDSQRSQDAAPTGDNISSDTSGAGGNN